ncbi:hypothetical protein NPIL_387981 [Nephila pilipes]|uniref:Uncharacterized protein n=1 Tax=Nephila pilipes TaxID=299642 RepID=A0A8X6TXM6_NEPPI|nr:hypothetical protein NPIL_387981 [Nephila pilipes]
MRIKMRMHLRVEQLAISPAPKSIRSLAAIGCGSPRTWYKTSPPEKFVFSEKSRFPPKTINFLLSQILPVAWIVILITSPSVALNHYAPN